MINHGFFGSRDVKPVEDTASLMSSLMRVIKGNPEIKRAFDEEERLAALADRRPAILAEVHAIRAASQRNIAQLAAAEAVAREELQRIEPRYEAIAAVWKRASQALDTARYQARADENRLLDELEKNADPIIDEAHSKLGEMWAHYHSNRGYYAPTFTAEPVGKSRRRPKGSTIWTNAPSIEKWKSAILAGMNELAAMKRDLDQSNVAERCAAILENVPDWKEVVEVEL
ncbi:hypothetical protein E0H66_23040 [Rhizobium leguminosarum bv. viciae]|uniref:hypothetical protein n=1 Tax=Rhizobium leguminosarum TaxID=384 RepID=UPI00103E8FAD|nr:hypothetical protein [Rhizobium leguminosarum]MBY5610906.1 hypothetical protein [Rhizobium leguminosarum]TCA31997.1 hypothetical protein E0H66_23040 [Rhizobium leguminosarum bv. viciae]